MSSQDNEAGDGEEDKPRGAPKSKRLQQTQAQVDEVVDIMKMNIEKVLERDTKLSQLDDRADALQEGASQFEKSAATLKNKMWLKNMKMIIIMVIIALIFLIIIFFYMGGTTEDITSIGEKKETETGDAGGADAGAAAPAPAAPPAAKVPAEKPAAGAG